MIFDARSVSRRWTTVTFEANFVRKIASSSAESPPPTTAIGLSRKKKPSQVAHVDTPWPISARSDGSPSSRADAPVATMSASRRVLAPRRSSRVNGRRETSTAVTSPWTISAPKRSACARISAISSGPMMPSRKPGKFSTIVVSISCPPASSPSMTSGLQVGARRVERGRQPGRAGPMMMTLTLS